ncbi:756_t:CDS:1, partial [Paraglomus occultum]
DKCDIELPNNSGIVDKQNWQDYFGPFAGRSYIYAMEGPPDVNTATRTQLELTEGIGKTYGKRIVDERKVKLFSTIEEVQPRCGIPFHVAKRLHVTPPNQD